jgi:hypothetical protein
MGGIIPAQANPLIGAEKFGEAILQQAMSARRHALSKARSKRPCLHHLASIRIWLRANASALSPAARRDHGMA